MISALKCLASVKFPEGTVFLSAWENSKNSYISPGKFLFTIDGDIVCNSERHGMVYNSRTRKWAEVISYKDGITDWVKESSAAFEKVWMQQISHAESFIWKSPVPSERDLLIKILEAFNLAEEIGNAYPVYIREAMDEIRTYLQSDHH